MSKLVIPITGKALFATGDVRLWADIDLLIKDNAGNFVPETFRVDSASDLTNFPAYEAKQFGLPMPQKAASGATHIQTGLEIRSGYLRFRVAGMDSTEYAVACLFLGDPNTPPNPNQPATHPRKLLQPFALLNQLRFTMDRDPVTGSLYGELVVEKK